MSSAPFFADVPLRRVQLASNSPFSLVGLALGQGSSSPLEVLILESSAPRLPQVRSLWKERNNGRAAPLLVVLREGGGATLCGPAGDDPPVYPDIDRGQAERLCAEALAQPDRHAALRYLRDALPAVESALPGVRNEGFLATHELASGAPRLPGWEDAGRRARPLLGRRDDALLRGLGFTLQPCDNVTTLLRAGADGTRVAVAVLLQAAESPELEADRFNGLSPVSYAMAVGDRERLPYVLLCQGPKLRLYPVGINVGVGRRGRTETFVEIHTGLLPDDRAAYLWQLFSQETLDPGGTLERLLDESRRFAGDLAVRLRQRIYERTSGAAGGPVRKKLGVPEWRP